jgi:hypothetical protein
MDGWIICDKQSFILISSRRNVWYCWTYRILLILKETPPLAEAAGTYCSRVHPTFEQWKSRHVASHHPAPDKRIIAERALLAKFASFKNNSHCDFPHPCVRVMMSGADGSAGTEESVIPNTLSCLFLKSTNYCFYCGRNLLTFRFLVIIKRIFIVPAFFRVIVPDSWGLIFMLLLLVTTVLPVFYSFLVLMAHSSFHFANNTEELPLESECQPEIFVNILCFFYN